MGFLRGCSVNGVPNPDEMSVDAGRVIARLQERIGVMAGELAIAQALNDQYRSQVAEKTAEPIDVNGPDHGA